MKFNDELEAVKRAVIILESLIEVSEKNDDPEMTSKLVSVKVSLESYLDNKKINNRAIQLCLEVFKLLKFFLTINS